MKNKRLLVILVIFFIVALLAVLSSVVFSIKKITVRFYNTLDYFVSASATEAERDTATEKLQNDIEGSLSYLKGRSIFFNVNTSKITNRIEAQEIDFEGFRLRVTSVKAVAPDELVITVRERYPVYKYTAGAKTVILDGDLRVLDTKIPVDKETGGVRRLIDLSTALPGISAEDLIIGGYLDTADSERAAIIKEIVPFFWMLENYEDAVTHIFNDIEFNESWLCYGEGADKSVTAPALVMKQYVANPKEPPNKNYFEIVIVNPSVNLKAKLTKVWMAVNKREVENNVVIHESRQPGLYEVLDWTGAQDDLLVFYHSTR